MIQIVNPLFFSTCTLTLKIEKTASLGSFWVPGAPAMSPYPTMIHRSNPEFVAPSAWSAGFFPVKKRAICDPFVYLNGWFCETPKKMPCHVWPPHNSNCLGFLTFTLWPLYGQYHWCRLLITKQLCYQVHSTWVKLPSYCLISSSSGESHVKLGRWFTSNQTHPTRQLDTTVGLPLLPQSSRASSWRPAWHQCPRARNTCCFFWGELTSPFWKISHCHTGNMAMPKYIVGSPVLQLSILGVNNFDCTLWMHCTNYECIAQQEMACSPSDLR